MRKQGEPRRRLVRLSGLLLALAWAAWWTWFGLASAFAERLGPGGAILHTAVPGLICLAIAVIGCVRVRAGAWLLMVAGAVLAIGYPILAWPGLSPDVITLTGSMLAVPPLVAGALLHASLRA